MGEKGRYMVQKRMKRMRQREMKIQVNTGQWVEKWSKREKLELRLVLAYRQLSDHSIYQPTRANGLDQLSLSGENGPERILIPTQAGQFSSWPVWPIWTQRERERERGVANGRLAVKLQWSVSTASSTDHSLSTWRKPQTGSCSALGPETISVLA